ncbi:SDR family oxidoreductase [Virgibacillus ainsalahensis]
MRVLVIGANGSVGKQVVEKLMDANHEPVAMVRKAEQLSQFEDIGAQTVLTDLEENFESAYDDVDAVIFAAGSGPNTGADKTIIIDQEGAIEATDLAKKYGINRFVLLSSMGADKPKDAKQIKHYLYAKHRADEYLKDSGLAYTILRPGGLTDDPGKGKVNLQEKIEEFGKVTREDVASVLVQILTSKEAENKVFELLEGDTPVSDL